MFRRLARAATTLAALVLVASCGTKSSPATRLSPAPADPQWSQIIAARSTGAISRHSPIRVVFADDVVDADRVGADASANLQVQPAVPGRITFVSRREIQVVPVRQLAAGTPYKVRVLPRGLTGIDAKIGAFEFVVETLAQNFSVQTLGLDVDPSDDDHMILRGTVTTADVEDGATVEKIVRAELGAVSLPVTWLHSSDHVHNFTVSAITRRDE